MGSNNYLSNTVKLDFRVDLTEFKRNFAVKKVEFNRIKNLVIPEKLLLELPELESIWIVNCDLAQFPNFVFEILRLKELCLMGTKLKSIPDQFGKLPNLNLLSFADNQLESIPESVFSLIGLEEFHICNNPIKKLSPGIGQLTKLKLFSINGTLIRDIPEEITQLKSLWYFDLGQTPTENMSPKFYSWLESISCLKRFDPIAEAIRKRDQYVVDTFGRQIVTEAPKVEEKKLIVNKSTIPRADEGVFADEDIPEGTVFAKYSDLAKKINDLAWRGNEDRYLVEDNLKQNINTIFVIECISPDLYLFFGHYTAMYLKSIKPIKKGDELSRIYGLDYWREFQEKKKIDNSNASELQLN